jgi:glyoxylase-like metal-dependent hydrolase (beta-lactamase superfamily II)
MFMDRKDVEIWVHDKELRAAFWSVATGADTGVYLEHYLKLSLNWKTFDDRTIDFCQGITLHHLPGHTDGKLPIVPSKRSLVRTIRCNLLTCV